MMKLFLLAFLCGLAAHAQQATVIIDPPGTSASEVTIALDPTNPDNLIAGANLNLTYRSTDGGATWHSGTLQSAWGVWGDPCLMFDETGTAYYAHLSNPNAGRWIDRIVVARSSDTGATWGTESEVGKRGQAQQDKEWLTCDRSRSARRGTIYMSWTEFDTYQSTNLADSSRILLARSTDKGASWSTPVIVSDIDGDCVDSDTTDEGAVPAVDTNGNLFVVWADRRGVVLDRSTDGGTTFGVDRVLAPTIEGWDLQIPGLVRSNGLPMIATDFSNGPHRGAMYIVWSDRIGTSLTIQVLMMRSTDNGATWSSPKRVNTDTTRDRDHALPAMAIDQTTGNLYIAYYDRRMHDDLATDVWLSTSSDGGATFHDTQVSSVAFTPSESGFLGDYIGIDAGRGRVYPIWTHMDGTVRSVVTAIVRDSARTIIVDRSTTLPRLTTLLQNYPNPFNARTGETTIRFMIGDDASIGGVNTSLVVFDMAGHKVKTLVDQRMERGEHRVQLRRGALPAGTYVYRLTVGETVVEREMAVL